MSISDIEAAIVARLTERLGESVIKVYTAAETAQIEEQLQVSPNITVVYNGYRPAGDVAGGAVQGVAFQFLVVVATKNATSAHRSVGARDDASSIIEEVMAALVNWRPVKGASILRLFEAPGASFSEIGFAYYPVAFEITRTYRGA